MDEADDYDYAKRESHLIRALPSYKGHLTRGIKAGERAIEFLNNNRPSSHMLNVITKTETTLWSAFEKVKASGGTA